MFMLRKYWYSSIFLLFFLLFPISKITCQTFGDKTFYLIDSLPLAELGSHDSTLVKTKLDLYHSIENDTQKVSLIVEIVNDMIHPVWEKYNDFVISTAKQRLTDQPTEQFTLFYNRALASGISNQGLVHDLNGKVDLAIEKYEEALKIYSTISDDMGISTTLNNLGVSHEDKGEMAKAMAYYNQALTLRKKLGDPERIAAVLINLGHIRNRLGQHDIALEHYFESLAIYDSLGSKRDIGLLSNNIGAIYGAQRDFEKALEYHQKSLKIREETEDYAMVANSLSNIGNCYALQGQSDTALSYFDQALVISEKGKYPKGRAEIFLVRGDLLYNMERYPQAIKDLTEGLNIARDLDYKYGIVTAYNSLAKVNMALKQMPEALTNIEFSLKLAQELNYLNLERNAWLQMSLWHKKSGDYQNGWEAYEKYIALRDSISNDNIKRKALLTETGYKLQAKDRELELSESEKALLVSETKVKNYYLIGAGLFILLLLTGIFIWYRFNTLLKSKKELEHQHELEIHGKEIELLRTKINTNINQRNIKSTTGKNLRAINDYLEVPLSERELKVLAELAKGHSNQEIADNLFVSINTIKSHLIKIYNKLEVKNRTQAVQKISDLEAVG